jgi:hypothetical protein
MPAIAANGWLAQTIPLRQTTVDRSRLRAPRRDVSINGGAVLASGLCAAAAPANVAAVTLWINCLRVIAKPSGYMKNSNRFRGKVQDRKQFEESD